MTRLSPGPMIAHALCDLPLSELSIEMLRACLESAPTWPNVWTRQEGMDYVCAYLLLTH